MSLQGKCLCQNVSLTVEESALPLQFAACYCLNCSTTAGSPFSMVTVIEPNKMTIKGETKSYTDKETKSGNTLTRVFCPGCGTPVVSKTEDGQCYVKMGLFNLSLDKIDPPAMKLFEENRDRRVSWLKGAF